MHYESTKQEFYEQELHRMAKQMSEVLAQGNTIEVCHSRSGLKLFSVNRRYVVVRREKAND
mgnify:CR=1 FL=1